MTDLSVPLVIGLFCCVAVTSASVVRYDQSQSGDINVQLQLKNIEVFAILDDSLFGEYGEYDYADFTEKPTKPSGSHNSTSNNATSSSPPVSNKPHDNDMLIVEDIFYNIVSNVTSRPHTNTTVSSTSTEITTETTTTASTTTAKTIKKCGSGFYRDTLGRCRRIRRPHLPLFSLGYRTRKAAASADV